MEKVLLVAIDPGYDGCKIVINKQTYHMPSSVEDISKVSSVVRVNYDEEFITYESDGASFLVGKYARKSLLETDHSEKARADLDTSYTLGKFGTDVFRVGVRASLGYALIQYSEFTKSQKEVPVFELADMPNWDVHVAVALPHEHMESLWKQHVKPFITGKHEFSLNIGLSRKEDFSFKFKEENCGYNSQTICALLSVITDDDGKMIQGKTLVDYLPAIILDGGYKTFGIFKLARDGRIDNPESNLDFAMHNVNEIVAAKIRSTYNCNVHSYMIEEYANGTEELWYVDDKDISQKIDVKAIRDNEIEEMAKKLIKHLLEKHNNLKDARTILDAGGTGEAYFKYIKAFCEEKRHNLKDNVKLADQGFNGEPCQPVFAIAIGLYKAMVDELDA